MHSAAAGEPPYTATNERYSAAKCSTAAARKRAPASALDRPGLEPMRPSGKLRREASASAESPVGAPGGARGRGRGGPGGTRQGGGHTRGVGEVPPACAVDGRRQLLP